MNSLILWKQVFVYIYCCSSVGIACGIGFDINFTDDVGQTLLNWASAFGTTEMVEYLLEQGADVNKGQRSSSLHYAACFGRPNIVKVS